MIKTYNQMLKGTKTQEKARAERYMPEATGLLNEPKVGVCVAFMPAPSVGATSHEGVLQNVDLANLHCPLVGP